VIPPLADMPNLPVARAVWKAKPNFTTSTECWLSAGGPHHTVMSTALTAEHLTDLAEMLGVELVLIDAETKTSQFLKELRWNNAYHRLAMGF
jgi:L-arabinose isomerase